MTIRQALFLFIQILMICSFSYAEETIWYWNSSDSLDANSHGNLKKIGITKLFLKAGHFWHYNGSYGNAHFKFPEPSGYMKNYEIHLVYTFSQSGRDNFYARMLKDEKNATSFVLDSIKWQHSILEHDSHKVTGLQFDLEGHVDLGLYTRFLKAVRKRFPKLALSIAVQPFWKKKPGFETLLKANDFYCLMLYDFSKSKTSGRISKIADLDWMISEISDFEQFKIPFYAGLPTYSYSLLYNSKGRLLNSWSPFRLEGLSENKYFRHLSTRFSTTGSYSPVEDTASLERKKVDNYNGEQITTFQAVDDLVYSNISIKKGYTVSIVRITPASVSLYLDRIKAGKFRYLVGNTYFRLGMDWEDHVLPSVRLLKGVSRGESSPLEVKICQLSSSFYFQVDVPKDVESICSGSASGLIIEFQNAVPEKIDAGEFDRCKKVGNRHMMYEFHIAPGEKIRTGLIPGKYLPLTVSAWFKDSDSFETIWSKKQYFNR